MQLLLFLSPSRFMINRNASLIFRSGDQPPRRRGLECFNASFFVLSPYVAIDGTKEQLLRKSNQLTWIISKHYCTCKNDKWDKTKELKAEWLFIGDWMNDRDVVSKQSRVKTCPKPISYLMIKSYSTHICSVHNMPERKREGGLNHEY